MNAREALKQLRERDTLSGGKRRRIVLDSKAVNTPLAKEIGNFERQITAQSKEPAWIANSTALPILP